ncbi:Uncharacterised protein [Mycobacterium tuberculosis]|uniref:Uncharacterized protein n=1 Tax=Mycobacterium tuberculosis TaxID=1773 RepID=A0A0U0TF45_MYCTX|nr:Uncharacterised protein [Mycobacterium tuberculosis]
MWKRRASRTRASASANSAIRAAGSDAGLTIANAAESSFSAFSRACRGAPSAASAKAASRLPWGAPPYASIATARATTARRASALSSDCHDKS